MSIPAIVLAGERPGGNALAGAFALPAGILVEVAGIPCITRVLTALETCDSVADGKICGPAKAVAATTQVRDILSRFPSYSWRPPQSGPAQSALAGLADIATRPVLITAADHALLTPGIIDSFCTAALGVNADFVVGLVPYSLVRKAFPESRRTVLRFANGAYCGSNLFLVRTTAGDGVVKLWQTLQSHRKKPWRMATGIGLGTLVAYVTGRLHLRTALDRLGDLAGCRIGYVEVPAARAAVDVDSVADHALAERILGTC